MAEKTISLEEIEQQSLEEILREVIENGGPVTVSLPGGSEILITPKPRLEPLPVLEGYTPKGWKDALYAPNQD